MKVVKIGTAACLGLCLLGGSLLGWMTAAAAGEPPPIVLYSPHSRSLALGESWTFHASAVDAAYAYWQVSSDGGTSANTYRRIEVTTKRAILKTSHTFGPFTASENGWKLRAVFVNDPTGVPSGIQTTATHWVVVTLQGTTTR